MDALITNGEGLDTLLTALIDAGYSPVGPVAVDGVVRYREVRSSADFPAGLHDTQEGGTYRLEPSADPTLFGFTLGQDSWKRFLNPPRETLLQITHANGSLEFDPMPLDPPKLAFFGIRACELAAIAIQDRVFLDGDAVNVSYAAARENVVLIAANCTHPSGTCFCASMGTGPEATAGFDLAFTELHDAAGHEFLFTAETPYGEELLAAMPGRPATATDEERHNRAMETAASQMGRQLDTDGIRDLLVANPDHARWDEVAARCLTCANCTMACPTCFCSTMSDEVDFAGTASRVRHWDSCFTFDFSSVHGVPVRSSNKARYRQWMTHKLGTWYDQFGTSGCVGCGRCITWCPVGIDITQEVAAIRQEVASP